MDWAQILVYILGAFLALFLLLAIILTVLLIKVTKQIKIVTNAAERTVHNIENTANTISSIVTPSVMAKAASTFINKIINPEKKGKK